MEITAAIIAIVFTAAQANNIPPELILAITEVESNGNRFAVKMEPNYIYTIPNAKRPAICTQDTEIQMQKTAWGLMQIMGATARDIGFVGWLPELIDAEVNITTGSKLLRRLMDKYMEKFGLDGVIAAYNGGHPRRAAEGKYRNQAYVNAVNASIKKYKKMIDENPEWGKQPEDENSLPNEDGAANETSTKDAEDNDSGGNQSDEASAGNTEDTGKDDEQKPEKTKKAQKGSKTPQDEN